MQNRSIFNSGLSLLDPTVYITVLKHYLNISHPKLKCANQENILCHLFVKSCHFCPVLKKIPVKCIYNVKMSVLYNSLNVWLLYRERHSKHITRSSSFNKSCSSCLNMFQLHENVCPLICVCITNSLHVFIYFLIHSFFFLRYLLCLQLRTDILTGRLHCPSDMLTVLGSYVIQSEFGDYNPELHGKEFFSNIPLAPSQTPELEENVTELHRTLKYLGYPQTYQI